MSYDIVLCVLFWAVSFCALYWRHQARWSRKTGEALSRLAGQNQIEICRLRARMLQAASAPTIEDARTILNAGNNDEFFFQDNNNSDATRGNNGYKFDAAADHRD